MAPPCEYHHLERKDSEVEGVGTLDEGEAFGGVGVSDSFAAVGATKAVNADNLEAGAVYLYQREDSAWTRLDTMTVAGGQDDDYLGSSVSVDGSLLVVGASGEHQGRGSAYVFAPGEDGTWGQLQLLIAEDGAPNDLFGAAVAVSGATIAVGAPGRLGGVVYVYRRTGDSWSPTQVLEPSSGSAGAFFGAAIAIAGGTMVVGAWEDDVGASDAGAAYVYRDTGTTWRQSARLTAPASAPDDRFGISVAVGTGLVVVGADGEDRQGDDTGAAHIFVADGDAWTHDARLLPSEGFDFGYFGALVAVDRRTVVVSAPDNDAYLGEVYVFDERCDEMGFAQLGCDASWQVTHRLRGAAGEEQFGYGVAARDGMLLTAGFRAEDSSASVTIFQRETGICF